MKEAYLYEEMDDQKVRCLLCNHHGIIKSGKKGLCNVRENRSGTLVSLVYGKVIASNTDPIAPPLFHFLPGSLSYSIATVGCNFRCLFCQNADISQMPSDHDWIAGREMSLAQIVKDAQETHSATIAYNLYGTDHIL